MGVKRGWIGGEPAFNALVQLRWRCIHVCACVCPCTCVCVGGGCARALTLTVCMRHNLTAFACTGSGVQAAPRLAVHFKVVIEGFGLFVVYFVLFWQGLTL